jgi:hypothetical protein
LRIGAGPDASGRSQIESEVINQSGARGQEMDPMTLLLLAIAILMTLDVAAAQLH